MIYYFTKRATSSGSTISHSLPCRSLLYKNSCEELLMKVLRGLLRTAPSYVIRRGFLLESDYVAKENLAHIRKSLVWRRGVGSLQICQKMTKK
jgi:hypothetical protein